MKRALKVLAIVLVVLLVALAALPFVINVNSFRPRLESELSSALGRPVTVGNLSLSILSGSIGAQDISIADDPAFSPKPFIQAKDLKVGVELQPLIFSKSLRVTELTLDHPDVVLLRSKSGTWNFSTLGGKSGASRTDKSSSSNPNLSVAKLNVKDGRVSVGSANSPGKLHVYDNVDIAVKDFSFTSRFPFTLSAGLPGKGSINLDGQAGPINPNDASATPVEAKVKVKHFDLTASGFVDPSSGLAGVADFDGTMNSDGTHLSSNGTVNAEQLKLAAKSSPAGRPVQVKYAIAHDLQKQAGEITQGQVSMGKAIAQLTGTYHMQGDSTFLNLKLNGQGMPVEELEAMLPAVGVTLPSGSSLKGGTLTTSLAIAGTAEKPVITGPIRLADTKLAGFDLGSKMSAVSKLLGPKGSPDTAIQNLSTDMHFDPSGIQTQNINLTVPAIGVITGTGSINPGGALDYTMKASLSGGVVGGIAELASLGNKGATIPFFIRGTTSNPSFVPDVKGMVGGQLKQALQGGQTTKGTVVDTLTGLFGKKKPK